ncbi:MAG: hypothetical protein GXP24_07230 [Planctomycetes bacterium]|nr:hypothetical protein [Planctomycetota bacterium]
MLLSHRVAFVVFAGILVWFVGSDVAIGANSGDVVELTIALDDLDQWVGEGKNGGKWRSFLRSKELREQLVKGHDADPAIVSRVLQQYRSDAKGLDKRRFVVVRRALHSWLDALQNQHTDDLAKLVWAARGDHVPLTAESIAAVRAKLRRAARQLENRLGGNDTFAAGWKDYLKWSYLEPHLSADAKITGQSLRDLDTVLHRLRSNKPGLEHPVFVRTANALESYRELAFWYALGQRRDTRPRYANFLLELEKQITRNLEKPTVESTRQIGKILGIMSQLGHSPHLVERISTKFDQPNVSATVSSTALQQLAQRPVSDTTPVRDVILGARVRGTANSTGLLSVKTLPADDHIAVELQLAGNIQSHTFSFKKPVRVGSLGSTNFVATKQLQISDERFYVLPASASAHTQTRIRSVTKTGGNFGRRLIEKIARKKVAESKPQAERIAARHAERQVAEKFDRKVVDALYVARQNYDNKFHPPLERIGLFPETLNMASTSSGIQIETTLASYKQISTDRLPPGVRVDNDLTLQVHESALNNFLPHLLAGAKIGQENESDPPRIEGEVPTWLKKVANDPKVKEQFVSEERKSESGNRDGKEASDFKPWAFVLNNEHPVSVSFDDQKITLRIRIAELKTLEDGEESIRKNWDFLVTYLVVQEGDHVALRREGEIEALPTGFDPQWFGDPRWDDKLTAKQVGVRNNLEKNINKRVAGGGGFPLEIPLPPIELPRANGAKQTLLLHQLDCDEGWLTLGYRLP